MSKKTLVPNWPPAHLLASGSQRKFRKVVGIDLHQTILDFSGPFSAFMAQLYAGSNMNSTTTRTYHPAGDPNSKIGYTEFERALSKFVQLSNGGYGSLTALPGAIEGLKRLRAAGIEIQIMTYVPGASDLQATDQLPFNTGIARATTKELLKKLGFPVEDKDIVFIAPHKKAWHMLDQGNKIPLLIEDNRTTASDVADKGLAAILVPTSYNQCSDIPGVLRVAEQAKPELVWKEVADHIISFFETLAANGQLVSTGGK